MHIYIYIYLYIQYIGLGGTGREGYRIVNKGWGKLCFFFFFFLGGGFVCVCVGTGIIGLSRDEIHVCIVDGWDGF